KAGFEAMQAGKLQMAINNYSNVLEIDSNDYDARLALGRLHYRNGSCDSAKYYYGLIYKNDSTDVEALNGFVKCFIRQGNMEKAIRYAQKAVKLMPEHVPEYLLLAKAYGYKGQMDKAIETYKKANKIDATYSQVWAGLGKMYYWKSKPATAERYYKKALDLDPNNKSIQKQFEEVKDVLKYRLKGRYQYVQEVEETYRIDALVQRYSVRKRLGDHFQLSLNFLLDYSNRDFENDVADTTRWFDNTWLKATWISEHHNASIYVGASSSDERLTTYGMSWKYNTQVGDLTIENTLDGGYNYFYYWNQVGRKSLSNDLKIKYENIALNISAETGTVDEKPVHKYPSEALKQDNNPYISYSARLSWQLLDAPKVKLGVSHSYYDYKYISADYYTPNDRRLTGPYASFYKAVDEFYFYGTYTYNVGSEKYYYLDNGSGSEELSGSIEADNWSASAEMGYNWNDFALSAGASRFYNPYYQNFTAFISLTRAF
ncbi:MAG: tetratricopeptide repeat protein, partial [Bacteroidales bacterium]|nr:tetratricopeptide repeat protein [Bacteroidales bacterium]MCF8338271.1 tetratricopeptide repeat protein [Bacteroidales bacterium]